MAARTKVFVDIVTKADGKDPGAGFAKLAVGIGVATVAFAALVKVGKVWSKAASDAAETRDKYSVIFRDISKSSERMADSFAEDFGLAGSSARELLGNTGDLITGLGLTQEAALDVSLATNTLAANVASLSNAQGGAAAVSAALTSAYTGEREALKTYGIIISEAAVKQKILTQASEGLTFASEQQAKIAATLAIAQEQSGNALNNVQMTWNSHANVVRRVEESTKSLTEELGKSVNKGLTPMLIITDDLVSSMAEWLQKSNELNDAIAQFNEGTATSEQTVVALNNELINQVTAMVALGDAQRLNIAGSAEAVKAQEARIEATRRAINDAKILAEIEAKAGADAEAGAKQRADAAEREKRASDETAADLKMLQELYAGTAKGQRESLEAQIAMFETWKQGPMVVEVLAEMKAELLGMTEVTEELTTAQDFMFDNGMVKAKEYADILEEQNDTVKELKMDYEALASDGLGAFASAFEEVGAGNLTLWEGVKQAGKDAISALLQSYARLWIAQAAAAAALLRFGTAGKLLLAATGAYAASGFVQSLATGGEFITDGPTLVGGNIVGDNASGQERVTVEPLGGGGGSNNNTGQIMILRIGDRDIKAVVQGWINNRGLHSSRGGAI